MRFEPILTLLILLFLLTACQPALRLLFDVKKERIENPESITSYVRELGINEESVFVVDSAGKMELGKYMPLSHNFFFYDPSGKRIVQPEGCVIADGFEEYFDMLINEHEKSIATVESNGHNFDSVSQYFRELEGNKIKVATKDSTYKAVATWAIYGGKGRMKILLQTAEKIKNSEYPIELFYVNTDAQEFWNLEKPPKTKLKIVK